MGVYENSLPRFPCIWPIQKYPAAIALPCQVSPISVRSLQIRWPLPTRPCWRLRRNYNNRNNYHRNNNSNNIRHHIEATIRSWHLAPVVVREDGLPMKNYSFCTVSNYTVEVDGKRFDNFFPPGTLWLLEVVVISISCTHGMSFGWLDWGLRFWETWEGTHLSSLYSK